MSLFWLSFDIYLSLVLMSVDSPPFSVSPEDSNGRTVNSTVLIKFRQHLEQSQQERYEPNWEDLSTRMLPEWYDKAKIGIIVHWGVYSVPAYGSEWFWYYLKNKHPHVKPYMEKNYRPGFSYQEFAPMFKAEFFDPKAMVELYVKAGAKYVIITAKHHDGFSLFPSKRSYWNSLEVGPRRDIVGDIANAVKDQGIKLGIYYSLLEWFNPLFMKDKAAKFTTKFYVESKLWPDIEQLVATYKPSILWSDGDWPAPDTYWKSEYILAWLYNDSPVKNEIVVNDRWGTGSTCRRGDVYNCDDRYNPEKLQDHKWENVFSLDYNSRAFRKNMKLNEVMPTREVIRQVISTVSCGGNVLINVGPTAEGMIPPIFQERLLELGEWLSINGEAIYETSPWISQKDSQNAEVWYTCLRDTYNAYNPVAKPKDNTIVKAVYAIFTNWPNNMNNTLTLFDISTHLVLGWWKLEVLGNADTDLVWENKFRENTTLVYLPRLEQMKSKYAWTLKFTKSVTQTKNFQDVKINSIKSTYRLKPQNKSKTKIPIKKNLKIVYK